MGWAANRADKSSPLIRSMTHTHITLARLAPRPVGLSADEEGSSPLPCPFGGRLLARKRIPRDDHHHKFVEEQYSDRSVSLFPRYLGSNNSLPTNSPEIQRPRNEWFVGLDPERCASIGWVPGLMRAGVDGFGGLYPVHSLLFGAQWRPFSSEQQLCGFPAAAAIEWMRPRHVISNVRPKPNRHRHNTIPAHIPCVLPVLLYQLVATHSTHPFTCKHNKTDDTPQKSQYIELTPKVCLVDGWVDTLTKPQTTIPTRTISIAPTPPHPHSYNKVVVQAPNQLITSHHVHF